MHQSPPTKTASAYIQAQAGIPSDEAFFKAWDGFRKRGIPCEPFDAERVHQRTLPLTRETLVAGQGQGSLMDSLGWR